MHAPAGVGAGSPPPGARGWRVAIESPDPGADRLVLSLADAAVATSADTEQHVEIDGVRYSHVIDPRTGMGLTARRSVTVVAPDATTADALASAVSVLGAERGFELLARHPGTAALVESRSGGGWRRAVSDGFPPGH